MNWRSGESDRLKTTSKSVTYGPQIGAYINAEIGIQFTFGNSDLSGLKGTSQQGSIDLGVVPILGAGASGTNSYSANPDGSLAVDKVSHNHIASWGASVTLAAGLYGGANITHSPAGQNDTYTYLGILSQMHFLQSFYRFSRQVTSYVGVSIGSLFVLFGLCLLVFWSILQQTLFPQKVK